MLKVIIHNLYDDESIPDPDLTPKGHEQYKHLASVFPYFGRIDMVCASPIHRAIQTAQITMDPFLQSGKKTILALPLAQEATDKPANTPSSIGRLQEEYGHIVNFERCMEAHPKDYDSKRGKWAPDAFLAGSPRARTPSLLEGGLKKRKLSSCHTATFSTTYRALSIRTASRRAGGGRIRKSGVVDFGLLVTVMR